MSYVNSFKLKIKKFDADVERNILILYDTKNHKYQFSDPTLFEGLIISKAKGEAIIEFLKWLSQ